MPSAPLFVHLAYQCPFLFVCFVGLYAGHPYIHLISFEIFLLACLCTFLVITVSICVQQQQLLCPTQVQHVYFQYYPAHALNTSPTHTCKEVLPVASKSRLAILHTTEQATELCDELQSPTCTFAISIATAKLPAWSHHVHAIMQ